MTFDVIGADDLRFTVTVEGEGHPVVVLHPGSSDADSWARVSERLADHLRVFASTDAPSGDSLIPASV